MSIVPYHNMVSLDRAFNSLLLIEIWTISRLKVMGRDAHVEWYCIALKQISFWRGLCLLFRQGSPETSLARCHNEVIGYSSHAFFLCSYLPLREPLMQKDVYILKKEQPELENDTPAIVFLQQRKPKSWNRVGISKVKIC